MCLKNGEFLLLITCGKTSPRDNCQRNSAESDLLGSSPLFLASTVWLLVLQMSRIKENAFFIHFLDFVLVVYFAILWSRHRVFRNKRLYERFVGSYHLRLFQSVKNYQKMYLLTMYYRAVQNNSRMSDEALLLIWGAGLQEGVKRENIKFM